MNSQLGKRALAMALAFLVSWEGWKLYSYQDGGGVWTICAGTTAGVRPGQTATEEQCWSMTERDYRKHELTVIRNITRPLHEKEQIALTSFCYNVGDHACKTSALFKRVQGGACQAAGREFGRWVYDNGRRIQGLANRRAAEAALFLEGCNEQNPYNRPDRPDPGLLRPRLRPVSDE